jgi:hypothetical protein
MSEQAPKYTDQQLYGANGQPQLVDIQQDRIFNCYLVSSMGALAEQQPDRIRGAIRFQPDPNHNGGSVFLVSLHHPTRGEVEIPVTQADIEDNIRRRGGGTADNHRGSPVWPSVMETAFAKLHDPHPQNKSLDDAYKVIGSETRGGSLHEAMFALTGEIGHNLRYRDAPKGSSAPPGNNGEKPPFDVPLKDGDVTRFDDANGAYALLRHALDANKAVTMSTRNANVNDGLMPHHAYVVTDIEQREKKDGGYDTRITLRNPYAHNNNTPPENKDTAKPTITVSLDKMLQNGVLGEFNLSPSPRVQTQQQAPPEQAAQTAPANRDPRNPEHPDHKLYKQIEAGVARIDTSMGRSFDATSERLTMAAFYDAKTAGITSADHIAMNTTGKRQPDGSQAAAGTLLFVVQGSDPSDPLVKRSITEVKLAVEQSMEHILQKGQVLEQQRTQSPQQSNPTQDGPMQDPPGPKGPKL